MPFVPDAPAASGQFVPDQPDSDLITNAVANARRFNPVDLTKGAMQTVKEGAYDLPLDLHQALAQLVGGAVTGQDAGQTPMGKRMTDIAQSEEVQHPGQWAYKNPIDAAMQAATVTSPFMPSAGAIQGGLDEGALRSSRFAQEQAVKSLEAARGQVRQVGPADARALGQMALDKGIVSPFTPTTLGMERQLQGQLAAAGEEIGAGRAAGDLVGGAPSAEDITQSAHADFSPAYETGRLAGRAGEFNRAMETLKNPVIEGSRMTDQEIGTFEGNAAKATEMYGQAIPEQKLAQSKESAYSDIGGLISQKNNAALQKALTPDQWSRYQSALNDYSGLSDIQKFFTNKDTRELSGRGQGLVTDLYKGVKDVFGHKALAAGADTLAKTLSSPAVAKALPTLVNAAKMGPAALETSHFMLQKHDPEYASATQGMGPSMEQTPAPDTPESIVGRVTADPQLAPWSSLFEEASKRGPQAVIANHFTLMQKDPQYNQAVMQKYAPPMR